MTTRARRTPEKKQSVEQRLDVLMTVLGVPADRAIREELSKGVAARINALVASGYRPLRWGDMRLCLRLEIHAWRARNRPRPRKAGTGGVTQ